VETLLIQEFQHLDFAIFDFDGTLTNLNINWVELREELHISSIEEIWDFAENERKNAWALVSKAELRAVEFADPIPSVVDLLKQIDFAILTNNSEIAVTSFLAKQSLSFSKQQIVGRTWLDKSKRNFERFSDAIEHILRGNPKKFYAPNNKVGYFGDSDYELEFSELIGLESFKVNNDGSISRFRGDTNYG
jgi:phosphoglycolate phosphatase-like HAD superfamily hydrolase